MAVVGVDFRRGRGHAAFVELIDEHGEVAAKVQSVKSFAAESWDLAIQHAVDCFGAWPLAVAVDAPDCLIKEVSPRVDMNPREMQEHTRLRAEEDSFKRGDDVRVLQQDGRWFYAALRRATNREIRNAARKAKAPDVSWIEYRPNAMMRRVDEDVRALVDMNEMRLYVRGDVFSVGVDLEQTEAAGLGAEISSSLIEAETTGFIPSGNRRLAIIGELQGFASPERFTPEAYTLDLRPDWTEARGAIATATTALAQGVV